MSNSTQLQSPLEQPLGQPRMEGAPHGRMRALRFLLYLLLSLLLLVALVEFGLRHILGLGNKPLMQRDSAAGYVLQPNQHLFRFFSHTDINQFSMRSPAFAAAAPAGTLRILLIGDSMTYGGTRVNQNQLFSSLLAWELPLQVHRPVEVLNASASAWAIGNELGYLESRGTFGSAMVLLVLNSGDIDQAKSILSDVGGEAATQKGTCALCEVWTRYIGPRYFHLEVKPDAGSQPHTASPANIAPNLEMLSRFQQIVEANHARMGVIYLACRAWVPDTAKQSAPPALVNWTQQHSVPLVDVTSEETRYSLEKITIDGVHFNASGHRAAADAIERNWSKLANNQPMVPNKH